MKFTLLAVAVFGVLLVVLYEVDAACRPCYDERYSWTYIVNDKINIKQDGCAEKSTGGDFAGVYSGDTASEKYNITGAYISYDYTKSTCITIIIPLKRRLPCFLFNTGLTSVEFEETIAAYNGTFVKGLPKVALDGTIELLPEEKTALMENSRRAQMACNGRYIFKTARTAVDPAKARNTTKIKVIGLEAEYTITYKIIGTPVYM